MGGRSLSPSTGGAALPVRGHEPPPPPPAPRQIHVLVDHDSYSAVRPAVQNLGNYHETGEIVPFVDRTFEWGVVIAIFLSVLSIVPRQCARWTYFLPPKLRKIEEN